MLNQSEAVYGFAAWLTCRKEVTIMSAAHDAAPVVELVSEFCDRNGFPPVSDQWPKELVHPG